MNSIFRILLAGTLACACICARATVPVIMTVAGGAPGGVTCCAAGDGGPATNAQLDGPQGVFVDAAGNLFIADTVNNLIRKVFTGGIITTVAGNGTGGNSGLAGHSGDGGPATSAEISYPGGVAVNADGILYIADTSNGGFDGRIRIVSSGIITTFAQLGQPRGVALDAASNLYVADSVYVRKVATNGAVTTVAGGGSTYPPYDGSVLATQADLGAISSVALDFAGDVLIALSGGSSMICKITPDGKIWTVVGSNVKGYSGDGGPATSATLNNPGGITVDASGNLFIADSGNNVIREVTPDGIIMTVAGTGMSGFSGDGGPPTNAQLYQPQGLFTPGGGILYIADTLNNRVRKVTLDDIFKNGFE